MESNVHYPTDLNLLWDALRKTIQGTSNLCKKYGFQGWRKQKNWLCQIKKLFLKAQRSKSRNSQEDFGSDEWNSFQEACYHYLKKGESVLSKVRKTLETLKSLSLAPKVFQEVEHFYNCALKQFDLIERRIFEGEQIPHEEKVFSFFEPHTEWISKGKINVQTELGVKVAVLEDQFGFLLHHQILFGKQDADAGVEMVKETKTRYPNLNSCSFDKGFHSPHNQKELKTLLEKVYLPKKGKCSKKQAEWEKSEEFKQARKQHSAVESAIHSLEVHGLDRCPDQGKKNFEKYVATAIPAQNLHRLGAWLQKKKKKLKS